MCARLYFASFTPHYHRYELRDGDIVNVDVSCFFKNHHADLNETYCVGNVDYAGR